MTLSSHQQRSKEFLYSVTVLDLVSFVTATAPPPEPTAQRRADWKYELATLDKDMAIHREYRN